MPSTQLGVPATLLWSQQVGGRKHRVGLGSEELWCWSGVCLFVLETGSLSAVLAGLGLTT